MESTETRSRRIAALQELVDRLCAPDLTLAESKCLRARLTGLLGASPSEQRADERAVAAVDDSPAAPAPCWPGCFGLIAASGAVG